MVMSTVCCMVTNDDDAGIQYANLLTASLRLHSPRI